MSEFVNDIITSRQNPLITRLAKLSDKKHRDAEGLMRLDGVKLFSEAVKSGLAVEYVFLAQSRREKLCAELADDLAGAGGRIYTVADPVLEKLTDEKAPQGIVAFCRYFDVSRTVDADASRTLLLSSIRDPGNLGTMIRTAYALGIDRVYISADCADLYSPKTLRAAMGTIFRQPLTVVEDERTLIADLRGNGIAVYAAALRENAVKLGSVPLPERVCVAIGNEGHGLSDEVIDACTGTMIIPMNPGCESLNAASAATVLIWEICRDRL
ncbi:MAG: RNA methyltransferase [Clostridia bacterium]|nr:RNA methyltransferase [Clostridia bacterium]